MSEELQNNTAPVLEKKNTSFKGDVFRLVGGTVIAQIIGVITIPIISRYFGPDAYGTAALFTAITSVLAVVACWRYELAIVIPEKDEEAASVFFVSLFATFLTTLLVSVLVAFWVEPIFKLLKSESLLPCKWFIPIFVFLQGLYMTFNRWNSRTKRFNSVAAAGIINSTTTRIINIITGFLGYASGGAMVKALTAGQVAASGIIGTQIIKNDSSFLKANFSFKEIFASIKRYKKFPLLSICCGFLNSLSSHLPPMLLAYYFNSTIVGFFAFGHRLLTLPMSFIGNSLAQVFFQRSAEAKHENKLGELTQKIFTQLFTLGIFPFMLLMIIAPEIFSLVFGNIWEEAGIYTQLLTPWVFCNFICCPITSITDTLNKQEIEVCFNILLIITRFFSLYIGGIYQNVYLALTVYSLTGLIVYLLWSYTMLKLAKSNVKILIVSFLKEFFVAIAFIIPIVTFKYVISMDAINLLVISSFISLFYISNLLKKQPEIMNKIILKFKKADKG